MKGGNTNCKMNALQRASKALLEASQCSINRESELPQAASPEVAPVDLSSRQEYIRSGSPGW